MTCLEGLFDGDFDLRDLAESGQCSLLEASSKYGALFLAFNKHLIILRNSQIYEITTQCVLPPIKDISCLDFKRFGAKKPIIFIKVCDKMDRVFVQCQDEELRVFSTVDLLQSQPLVQYD